MSTSTTTSTVTATSTAITTSTVPDAVNDGSLEIPEACDGFGLEPLQTSQWIAFPFAATSAAPIPSAAAPVAATTATVAHTTLSSALTIKRWPSEDIEVNTGSNAQQAD
ncbi:hypothetical protein E2C01_004628 [Portunus trituberculatus]|uniref:Uncharacterized protein n=1 Tax=Portunus trituberculatus TaxID=210409 RepID=A0A5B7CSU4_PORTR|nr:hypothetical protein [Portunus trituberculatus]